MRDLLATAGAWALADLALPLALWTAVALLAEGALRATRAHAAVGLPVRSALVAALPAVLLAGPIATWLVPAGLVAAVAVPTPREILLPEIVAGGMPAVAAGGPPAEWIGVGAALVAACLVGVVALVRLAAGYVRLRQMGWTDAPADVQARAAVVLRETGVSRPVRVVVGPVPFTFGWRRPVVAVPAELSGEALGLALAHEAAHVRAGDFAAHALASTVAAVFAAHPLAGVLVRQMALDRERLADAVVLARRPAAGRAYGSLLVSFAAVPVPRLAVAASGRSFLLARLATMTSPTSPDRLRAARKTGRLLAALTLTAVTLAGFALTDAPAGTRAFRLVGPSVTVDGHTFAGQNSRFQTEALDLLTVTAMSYGRFIVSDSPFRGAVKAGAFDGRRLVATVDGHTLAVVAQEPMFEGSAPVAAFARFDPTPRRALPIAEASLQIGLTSSLDHLGSVDIEESERELQADIAAGRVRVVGGTTAPPPRDSVYDAVDAIPEMVGGMAAFAQRLVAPTGARGAALEGVATVRFVVGRTGTVTKIKVAESSGDTRLDSAAVQAVRRQTFMPGRVGGRDVAVRLVLPVRFAPPAVGVVRYAGVDLARLANGDEIRAIIDALPARLAAEGAPYGDVRVGFLIDPDGTTRRFRVDSGPRDLHGAVVDVARRMRFAEDARPGAPVEDFFRLWHTPR